MPTPPPPCIPPPPDQRDHRGKKQNFPVANFCRAISDTRMPSHCATLVPIHTQSTQKRQKQPDMALLGPSTTATAQSAPPEWPRNTRYSAPHNTGAARRHAATHATMRTAQRALCTTLPTHIVDCTRRARIAHSVLNNGLPCHAHTSGKHYFPVFRNRFFFHVFAGFPWDKRGPPPPIPRRRGAEGL